MEPNPLPDWTEDDIQRLIEKLSEEVKKEGDRIFSGMATNGVPNSSTCSITIKDLLDMKEKIEMKFPDSKGVYITSIVPPEHGWPIVAHCEICKKTVIVLSPYAIKPSDGDYFRLNGTCLDDDLHIKHNMYPQTWYPWREEKIKFQPLDPIPQDNMQAYLMKYHVFGPYDAESTQKMPIEEAKKRWPNTPIPGEEK